MTSAEFARNRDNYCYRHPDRQSFVLCQRCLRTICPECQTQAPVGVICPDCLKAQRKAQTPAQRKAGSWGRRQFSFAAGRRPVVTLALVAVTAFVGLLQLIPGLDITGWFLFAAPYLYPNLNGGLFEPWRLVTAMFVHSGIWHLALNMLSLWLIGRSLEPMLGRWRFLALYLIGGFGGQVAVACLAPMTAVVGASGAVFALFGALLVIGRHLGADITGILVILGLNLVIGFIPGFHIAWQAHIGGAVVGALVGVILLRTRKPSQRTAQILLLAALVVALVIVVAVVPPIVIMA